MGKETKIGVLISGSGSNLQAIIDSVKDKSIDATIEVVLSDNDSAGGLERARKAGIPTEVVSPGDFQTRVESDKKVVEVLKDYEVNLVCLAGYMRLISSDFIQAFPERIINIHPSLLPSFPGLNVQKKALEYGAKFSGCTVHFVDEGVDTGPVIIQAVVPIHSDDTVESLSKRILTYEHRIYPEAVRLIAEGRVRVEGREVIIDGALSPELGLVNPIHSTTTKKGT